MGFAVLLDTSFLLPSFGVDTGDTIRRCLRCLSEHKHEVKIYYSRYGVLEAVLVLLREVRRGRLKLGEAYEMVEVGVSTVVYSLEAVDECPRVFRDALKLYGMEHRDIFDNILYSTALTGGMYLLTVDKKLKMFIRENGLKDVTLDPEGLLKKLL
ncbi:MAG: twitching motility protein PilT [Candidatus Bathyarchaeota archaeon B24]|nr:MAG: twitching motility protein PilT [Candidatus Bathyarchaeota archaeon B24]